MKHFCSNVRITYTNQLKDRQMKKVEIGMPCSPSYMVSSETLKVKKVLVSYGGGMGGASKTYFCTEVYEPKPAESMRVLTLLTGEIVHVNGKYIVEIKNRDVVKLVTNITGHKNYNSKVCSKAILTEFIELLYGEIPIFIEGYTARHTDVLEGRVILSNEEVE